MTIGSTEAAGRATSHGKSVCRGPGNRDVSNRKLMKVHWVFDEEEWDPFTLLGEIRITGNHKSEIRDDCLILDTWFLLLLKGLNPFHGGVPKEWTL